MIVLNCYEYSDNLLFPFFHFHFLDMPTADRWFITDQSSAAKTFRGREIGRRWSDNQPADNLRPLSTPIFTTFSISEGIGRIWGANFARAEFFVCNRNSICEIINKWFAVRTQQQWWLTVREDINGKKRFLSGIARMRGGGLPMPEFLGPFFHHVFPYILTSISCYLILFGHF